MINLQLMGILHSLDWVAFHLRHYILIVGKIHSNWNWKCFALEVLGKLSFQWLQQITKSSTDYQHLVSKWGQCQRQISFKYFEILQSFSCSLHMNSHSGNLACGFCGCPWKLFPCKIIYFPRSLKLYKDTHPLEVQVFVISPTQLKPPLPWCKIKTIITG